MAHMLGTQAESGEDQRKGVVRGLRQKLARLRRQLRDLNNDIGALGDDPYDMGAAFIADGDGSSDDECVGADGRARRALASARSQGSTRAFAGA